MGQNNSIPENLIPDTVETLNYEVRKHAKILSEIGTLTYDEFQNSLSELNALSRKCIDSGGKQLVFAVKKGTDSTLVWKATVRIACVKVDPVSRQIESYKLINLKQFLRVFQTFQSHLEAMVSSENQRERRDSSSGSHSNHPISASLLMDHFDKAADSSPDDSSSSGCSSHDTQMHTECCICLDRKPEVMLPCAHAYCCPCIEQWNVNNKTCPICQEKLDNTDDSWVLSELPNAQEVNDEIFNELMGLSKNDDSQ